MIVACRFSFIRLSRTEGLCGARIGRVTIRVLFHKVRRESNCEELKSHGSFCRFSRPCEAAGRGKEMNSAPKSPTKKNFML